MSHKIKPDSPLATGKLPTGEQIAFDLLPDEDRDSFMREMLAADTDPNYSESVALQISSLLTPRRLRPAGGFFVALQNLLH